MKYLISVIGVGLIVFFVIWGVLAIIIVILNIKGIPKCEKCGVKMKLYRSTDNLSWNVSNNLRIHFIKGVPIKEKLTYICKTCNYKKTIERRRIR